MSLARIRPFWLTTDQADAIRALPLVVHRGLCTAAWSIGRPSPSDLNPFPRMSMLPRRKRR